MKQKAQAHLFWFWFFFSLSDAVVKPKSEKEKLKELFPALCRPDNPNIRVRSCFQISFVHENITYDDVSLGFKLSQVFFMLVCFLLMHGEKQTLRNEIQKRQKVDIIACSF